MSQLKILSIESVRQDAEKIMSAAQAASHYDFILALGGTEVSDRDGVSAAGLDAESRRLTAKLDAEALINGCTASGEMLPTSPLGVTSPVVLTRACLGLLESKITLVDCGCFTAPQVPHESLSRIVGQDFARADSLPAFIVRQLFEAGLEAGGKLADGDSFAVIAECVPGGTTTASAVLELLGINATTMLSSSVPGNAAQIKSLKAEIIAALIERLLSQLSCSRAELTVACRTNPLQAIAYAGDPMQAYAAGIVVANAKHGKKPLILAGGSQMLAVYALAEAILHNNGEGSLLSKTAAVVTTKWVAFDPYAETQKLAHLIGAPYVAACPDFNLSRHAGLRAYEEGHVKEGVGAGAALALALQKYGEAIVLKAIDETYRTMTKMPAAQATRQKA